MSPAEYRLGGYREFAPPPDLARFVDRVWVYARPVGAPPIPGAGHRVLPDSALSVCFESFRDRGGRFQDGQLTLLGPIRTPRLFAPAPGRHMEAVQLKPEWASALLGVEARSREDLVLAWRPPGDPVGDRLEDRLRRAASPPAVTALLLDWLRSRVVGAALPRSASLAHAALEAARASRTTNLRVEEMARELQVSERHLRRVVLEHTGASLKRHHRIRRLWRVVSVADAARVDPSWARLAVAAGFYDQSHLIREFRALVDRTPAQVHRERAVQARPDASRDD